MSVTEILEKINKIVSEVEIEIKNNPEVEELSIFLNTMLELVKYIEKTIEKVESLTLNEDIFCKHCDTYGIDYYFVDYILDDLHVLIENICNEILIKK